MANNHSEGTSLAATGPQEFKALLLGKVHLTSTWIRLSFGGADVARFVRLQQAHMPGAWIKLQVRMADGTDVRRAYTLRHVDISRAQFDIDVFVHDGGRVCAWANAVEAGQLVSFSGPRGGGFRLRPESRWLLLFGDETALPAIQVILASLPAQLPAIVLLDAGVASEHDALVPGRDVALSWVSSTDTRNTGGGLVSALGRMPPPPEQGQAWGAGEADNMGAVRRILSEKWAMEATDISARPYWKQGTANFRPERSKGS